VLRIFGAETWPVISVETTRGIEQAWLGYFDTGKVIAAM